MSSTQSIIFARLKGLVDKIIFLNKRSVFAFQNTSFFPSEVHVMLAVKANTRTNITRMAEGMGVTKGALSQTITRLAAKGVLIKNKDAGNNNELILTFTPFGNEALAFYEQLHETLQGAHARILEDFSDHEQAAIQKYLEEVAAMYAELD